MKVKIATFGLLSLTIETPLGFREPYGVKSNNTTQTPIKKLA